MRIARLSVLSILVAVSMFAACGGDDGGGGGNIDAPVVVDAPPDAAPASGLGKACVAAMMNADCPANAPRCVGFTGAGGTYCTPLCVSNGTATGAAMGQFAMIMPAPSDSLCAAAFSGSVGTPRCVGILGGYMPADAMPVVGRAYTNINMSCAIQCGASNACPAGLTANTSLGGGVCICVP